MPVNGACGSSSNGGTFTIAPATSLCAADTASAVTGSGPWSWSCNGSNGGSNASCSAVALADTTPPTLTLSTIADNAITANPTLNVSGTVSDSGSGVKSLTVNGQAATVAADGSFSVAITLVDGANSITTMATDNADNATTDKRTITLDRTAPTLTITLPADNSISTQALATITGTVSETSTVTVKVNNGTPQSAALSGNSFSIDVNLVSGLNTIDITAADQVGNSNSGKRTITSDTSAPTLTLGNPAQDISTTESSVILSGTVTDSVTSATIGISADGRTYSPVVAADGSFSQTISLPSDKTYAIVVTATDEAGNVATVPRNIIKTAAYATGDLNGDGRVDIADALKALRIAAGVEASTPALLLLADVAPLVNGKPAPDGVIDIADALVILEKSVGLVSW